MKLGELELYLISQLREHGPITPSRLLENLEPEKAPSFSTLAITLRRLAEKNLVKSRPLKGKSTEYWVDITDQDYIDAAADQAARILQAFGFDECPPWCDGSLVCGLLARQQKADMDKIAAPNGNQDCCPKK